MSIPPSIASTATTNAGDAAAFTQVTSDGATHAAIDTLFQNLGKLIDNLLIVLSPKEKYIIERRFGLAGFKRETLERIGKHFKITRERVRQIENNALKKLQRTAANTNLKIINEYGRMLIEKNGSIMSEDKLISEIRQAIESKTEQDLSSIQLSLTLDKDICKSFNTINYRPYWSMTHITHKEIEKLAQKTTSLIAKKQQVVAVESLIEELSAQSETFPNNKTYTSLLDIDKRIKVTKEGTVGLTSWRHINPRTIKDKILYILKKKNEPMHFLEISQHIIDEQFDQKKTNIQAVHNELIRNPQFVLIGRGIYALEEWGYKKGTVSAIIEEILGDGKAHSQEEIIEKVLGQRKIKKITILLNLKNKKKFQRVGRYMYQLND